MTYRFKAFLKDPDAERPDNPIHSTSGGQSQGFQAALVGGVHVYGWTTGAFLEASGNAWLDHGWAEIAFRKPVYDGNIMTVNLTGEMFTVTNAEANVCLEGRAGMGDPPFEIGPIPFAEATLTPSQVPALTLETAPVGDTLNAMAVTWTAADQASFLDEWLGDDNPVYRGDDATTHPAWVARQPNRPSSP
ncbi:MAG: hypothetical protein U5O39_14190 [Gammaproteobacteria bacterium]|nr:hypothetical protein [Gammaproteobacteria bacterium]